MSRREFLKQISALAITAGCAFAGGKMLGSNKKVAIGNAGDSNEEKFSPDPFKGCKSSGFKFSCPIPYNYELIDEVVEINKTYKKSKLVTFYGSMPDNINPLANFNSPGRGANPRINSFEDFANYIKYVKNKGFNFVYLFNSPKPFFAQEYEYFKPQFEDILNKLKKLGVYNIKVANTQMFEVLKNRPEFNVQASTCLEYTNIVQMQNFLEVYPRVKNFNLAADTNRNITFLKSLRKNFKDMEFELMADEACLFGCPARISHPAAPSEYIFPCSILFHKGNRWATLFRTNSIYPWNLDYYASIGYKNFKLVGYRYGMRSDKTSVAFVRDYFEAVENGIEGYTIGRFFKSIGIEPPVNKLEMPITKEMTALLPDLNHFIKAGDKCSANCGVNCNYCKSLADKMTKIMEPYV